MAPDEAVKEEKKVKTEGQQKQRTTVRQEQRYVEFFGYDDDFDEFKCCCPHLHVKTGIYFIVAVSVISILFFGVRIAIGSYTWSVGLYLAIYSAVELVVVVLLLVGLWTRKHYFVLPFLGLLAYNIAVRIGLIVFCVWVSFADYDPLHLFPIFNLVFMGDYQVRKGLWVMIFVFTSIFAIFFNIFFILVTNSLRRYLIEVSRTCPEQKDTSKKLLDSV